MSENSSVMFCLSIARPTSEMKPHLCNCGMIPPKKEGNQLKLGWGEDLQRENPIFSFENPSLVGLFLEPTQNFIFSGLLQSQKLSWWTSFFVDAGRLSPTECLAQIQLQPSNTSLAHSKPVALRPTKHCTSLYQLPCNETMGPLGLVSTSEQPAWIQSRSIWLSQHPGW